MSRKSFDWVLIPLAKNRHTHSDVYKVPLFNKALNIKCEPKVLIRYELL